MSRFLYLNSNFDLVALSAIVITLALSIAFIPWLRLVFTAVLQIPTQFAWEYLYLQNLWKFLHLDYRTLKQKKLKTLSYISKHQGRVAERRKGQKDGKKAGLATEDTMSNHSTGTASNGDEQARREERTQRLTSFFTGRRTWLRHRKAIPMDVESGVDLQVKQS